MISHAASRRRLDRKWKVFATIAIGTFVSVVDQTGVSLALPPIADHFDAAIPTVQWVALGYILTTGSLLMPMGRLSDMVGRKRVYTAGFVVFVLFAGLTGSSTSLLGLILFRVLQGTGAAMIQANGMAILISTFPGNERGKVIGLFMTMVGAGAIAGPVVGGLAVSLFGWRSVFLMAVPFGLFSIAAALLFLEGRTAPSSGQPVRRVGFDWPGAALSSSALAAFLLVMTNAYRVGWGSPLVTGGFAGVAVLFTAFVMWELRSPAPMLALELFKRRLFSLGASASFFSFVAGASVFFLMPFYLQEVLGHSPGRAGLIIAPSAICFALTGPIAGRLSDRFGWRRFEVLGLIAIGGSLLLLSRLDETSSVLLVVAALVTQGMGMGTFYPPNASAVLSTVDTSGHGVATAFLNMVRNTANVTGVALATTVVTATMGSLGYEPSLDVVATTGGGPGVRAAFTQGLQTSFLVLSGFIVIALALSIIKGEQSGERPAVGGTDHQVPSRAQP